MSMPTTANNAPRIAVIGGGAAGMLAAAVAARCGASVTLFEKNPKLGKKLAITGKGRCNVTNDCSPEDFIRAVPRNPRFLFGAINGFTPEDTKAHFEALGVALKTERGNRVFPVSDNAHEIVDAMVADLKNTGVKVRHTTVTAVLYNENKTAVRGIAYNGGEEAFDRVIVCTGGLSYPGTGSTGDGYRFARDAGIEVTQTAPSLVPLVCAEPFCAEMMGLSLKNTALTVRDAKNKVIYEDFGEMLFTHFGVSGPMILSASAHLDKAQIGTYVLHLDLKPALDEKKLDARILSDFKENANKNMANTLISLLPSKMIPVMLRLSGISPEEKCNSVTKEQRRALLTLCKDLPIHVRGFRPIAEAIITSGGVSTKALSPKTMEAKDVFGLYFAGEVIDVDGYTGGYNLQIAFSTAVAAARAASEF